MTEQEYDEVIAPMIADIARKVKDMGGSMVARVEWDRDEVGITCIGITEKSGAGQQLTRFAALSRGNFDALYIAAARHLDMSQTVVWNAMSRTPTGDT
jgi:hypothetical protein